MEGTQGKLRLSSVDAIFVTHFPRTRPQGGYALTAGTRTATPLRVALPVSSTADPPKWILGSAYAVHFAVGTVISAFAVTSTFKALAGALWRQTLAAGTGMALVTH